MSEVKNCPTCGSDQRDKDRSPRASKWNWDQWKRDTVTYVCPDPWHTEGDR
jgi:hypothetical protein